MREAHSKNYAGTQAAQSQGIVWLLAFKHKQHVDVDVACAVQTPPEKDLRDVFSVFDRRNTGFITIEGLRDAMKVHDACTQTAYILLCSAAALECSCSGIPGIGSKSPALLAYVPSHLHTVSSLLDGLVGIRSRSLGQQFP